MGIAKTVKTVGDLGEFGLIDAVTGSQKFSSAVVQGIGDDTAVVRPADGGYELLTTDLLIENIHFKRSFRPRDIGRKALACSISDIAAMGGEPRYALVSLGVPVDLSVAFVRSLYQGIRGLADKHGVTIVGGDTVKSQSIVINVALTGWVKKKHLVTRSGAGVGDVICVTGALGNSFETGHHLRFQPRTAEASWLVRKFKPTAMIDVSDGLAADLGHILKASDVGAELDVNSIPLRKGADVMRALSDGEDFELCLTMDEEKFLRWQEKKSKPFHLYNVGQITESSEGFVLVESDGQKRPLTAKGFTHF